MYQSSIAHLPYQTGTNAHGICSLKAVPVQGIATLPRIIDQQLNKDTTTGADFQDTSLTLKSGYDWLNIVPLGNYNINLAYNAKRTAQGLLHTYTLRIQLPNDHFDNIGKLLRGFEKQQFVLRIKLNTGTERIIGNAKRGALLEYEADSGTIAGNPNMCTVGFTFVTAHQAFYLINA